MTDSTSGGGARSSWQRALRECERWQRGPRQDPTILALHVAADALPEVSTGMGVSSSSGGRRLQAEIIGPDCSPFAAAHFHLELQIVDEYPFRPPRVRFMQPQHLFHPNICSTSGGICLDFLNNHELWSPALGLEKLLLSISSLLAEPRTEHGLNEEALLLLRRDPDAYATHASAVAGAARPPKVERRPDSLRNTVKSNEVVVEALPNEFSIELDAVDALHVRRRALETTEARNEARKEAGGTATLADDVTPHGAVVDGACTGSAGLATAQIPSDHTCVFWLMLSLAVIVIGLAQQSTA